MKVLIAIDDFREGEQIAAVAHRLFGGAAEYLVMNVAPDAEPTGVGWAGMGWGAAYPLALPLPVAPVADDPSSEPAQSAKDQAARLAGEVAESAHLGSSAQSVGEVGDPATAIGRAADDNDVDVIVVGSHERSWFGRLFSHDVAGQVLRKTSRPVLVVR
jgi:nucleotide-binding universal stress UspA family protein